ncbi:hypothetical protein E1262_17835 [Jiangella aurantiaca]|uniref:Uncharacterized protein n=1 Tax=Jiangella aurantiaca TaxID=2530373 RepID=A0A4R5AA99_9ACTN|nr:hypothetical protein [Jiangella aurantiaca]TDD67869.1 hypothetical protein E1262_17835 [Jiangella aurantiaca]
MTILTARTLDRAASRTEHLRVVLGSVLDIIGAATQGPPAPERRSVRTVTHTEVRGSVMNRIALIVLGLVVLVVIGVGGVVLQRQGERMDELEASVRELRLAAQASSAETAADRLDEIERQLGFDAPSWPAEAVDERITQLEWDLGLICGYLHRTGAEVLC